MCPFLGLTNLKSSEMTHHESSLFSFLSCDLNKLEMLPLQNIDQQQWDQLLLDSVMNPKASLYQGIQILQFGPSISYELKDSKRCLTQLRRLTNIRYEFCVLCFAFSYSSETQATSEKKEWLKHIYSRAVYSRGQVSKTTVQYAPTNLFSIEQTIIQILIKSTNPSDLSDTGFSKSLSDLICYICEQSSACFGYLLDLLPNRQPSALVPNPDILGPIASILKRGMNSIVLEMTKSTVILDGAINASRPDFSSPMTQHTPTPKQSKSFYSRQKFFVFACMLVIGLFALFWF